MEDDDADDDADAEADDDVEDVEDDDEDEVDESCSEPKRARRRAAISGESKSCARRACRRYVLTNWHTHHRPINKYINHTEQD